MPQKDDQSLGRKDKLVALAINLYFEFPPRNSSQSSGMTVAVARRKVIMNKHVIMHTLEVSFTICAQLAEFTLFGSKVGPDGTCTTDDPTDAKLPNRLVSQ